VLLDTRKGIGYVSCVEITMIFFKITEYIWFNGARSIRKVIIDKPSGVSLYKYIYGLGLL
jgi:hypothetical protein